MQHRVVATIAICYSVKHALAVTNDHKGHCRQILGIMQDYQEVPTEFPEKALTKDTAYNLLLHLAGLLCRSSDISDPIHMRIP